MQKKKAAYKAAKVNDCIPIISQDIESIKALLLERLEKAVDRGRYIKSLCPFHGENIPSFVVYLDTLTYHCFACGAHGTVQELLKHFNVNTKIKIASNTNQLKAVFSPDIVDEGELMEKAEQYFFNLHGVKSYQVSNGKAIKLNKRHDYWFNRGISLPTLLNMGIGCGEDKRGFFYSVPYFWTETLETYKAFHVIAIKKIYPKQGKNGKDSYGVYPEGISIPIYNQPAILWAKTNNEALIAFEGEKDVLMGIDKGYMGIGIAGKNVFKESYIPLFRGVKELLLWFDNDAIDAMENIKQEFDEMRFIYSDLPKVKVFNWDRYPLPKGGDFTDLIKGGRL
jgi:hypothetical protein